MNVCWGFLRKCVRGLKVFDNVIVSIGFHGIFVRKKVFKNLY